MPKESNSNTAVVINNIAGDGALNHSRNQRLNTLFQDLNIPVFSFTEILARLHQKQAVENVPDLQDLAHKDSVIIFGGDGTQFSLIRDLQDLAIMNNTQTPSFLLIGGFGGQNMAARDLGTKPPVFESKIRFAEKTIRTALENPDQFINIIPWRVNSPDLSSNKRQKYDGRLTDGQQFLWTFGGGTFHIRTLEGMENQRHKRFHWQRAVSSILTASKSMLKNHKSEHPTVIIGSGREIKAMDIFMLVNFKSWGAMTFSDVVNSPRVILLGTNPAQMPAFELVARTQMFLLQKLLKGYFEFLPEPHSPAVEVIPISSQEKVIFNFPEQTGLINIDSVLFPPARTAKTKNHLTLTIRKEKNGIPVTVFQAPISSSAFLGTVL